MKPEIWAEVRRLYLVDKMSKRRIAEVMRLDRKTVRRAIAMETWSAKPGNVRLSKLEPYTQEITEILKQYPEISGVRIHEELKKKGYGGGISILRDYVRTIRLSQKEAYMRVETQPGEQAQADWADCGTMKIGEHTRKLSCFVIVLSYSRLMYAQFTLSQRLEDFMRCQVNAFKFFRGIPQKILYDNLKSVVLVRFGREIRFNPRFEAFGGHYLFQAIPCNLGRGNEKGRVESGIKYLRINFLAGRTFISFADIQAQLATWLADTANVRNHGTTKKRPVDMYPLEQDKLLKLPEKDYDTDITLGVKSTKDCRVRFDANTYSVPHEHATQSLCLRAGPDMIRIYRDEKLLAEHRRSYEKYQVIEDPKHYAGLLAIKKKARQHKVRDMFVSLGEGCESYLTGLVAAELNISRQIEKILDLVDIYGKTEVLGAINHALRYNAYGHDYIMNIILQQRRKRSQTGIINPIAVTGYEEFTHLTVEERDLNLYDTLFTGETE